MSDLSITHRSVMQDITEEAERFNTVLEWATWKVTDELGHDFSCEGLASYRLARLEQERLQQEDEIRAETNIPQHLVW